MFNFWEKCSFLSFVSKTLSTMSILSLGVGVSVVVVSIFVKGIRCKNHKCIVESESSSSSEENENHSEEVIEKNEEKYEDKYLKEYKNLENKDIDPNNIKFIEELTPKGIVKMSYDPAKNVFIYYTNYKESISYKYLETVARFFTINHDCKNIYIDYEEELKKAIDNQNSIKVENQELEEKNEKKRNIFANLKNSKTYISKTSNKKWIIPERTNQYNYQGKIIDYDELINSTSISGEDNDFDCIDYSSFKKNIKKNLIRI